MSQSSELQQIQRRALQAVVELRLLGEYADLQIARILYEADRTAALNSYRAAAVSTLSRSKS